MSPSGCHYITRQESGVLCGSITYLQQYSDLSGFMKKKANSEKELAHVLTSLDGVVRSSRPIILFKINYLNDGGGGN
jgi:hypothetical protein